MKRSEGSSDQGKWGNKEVNGMAARSASLMKERVFFLTFAIAAAETGGHLIMLSLLFFFFFCSGIRRAVSVVCVFVGHYCPFRRCSSERETLPRQHGNN